jgi:hypothetical protein
MSLALARAIAADRYHRALIIAVEYDKREKDDDRLSL